MFPIVENKPLVPNLHVLTVSAPEIARAVKPGQFVIVRAEDDGERIPLTVSDWDPESGTLTLIFSVVGRTTQKLASLSAGGTLPTVVGPLGNPMEMGRFGTSSALAAATASPASIQSPGRLRSKGNRVTMVVEARSSYLLYWQDKLKSVSDQLIVITRDGSQGLRGHIGNLPKIIAGLPAPVDRIIINGCNYLMMRGSQESQPLNIKTIVSLNTLMIDGTGMCGVCRVTVGTSTKFACVDGPHFDGHEVNWDELAQRRKAYLSEEAQPFRSSLPQ